MPRRRASRPTRFGSRGAPSSTGLLAHELGHELNPKATTEQFRQCALAAGYLPVQRNMRESERLATERAIGYMKASHYDPFALLDLFS